MPAWNVLKIAPPEVLPLPPDEDAHALTIFVPLDVT
jgi:hypothetical protein